MPVQQREPFLQLSASNDALAVGCEGGNQRSVGFQLVDGGSWAGTVTFEGTVDDKTWVATAAYAVAAPASVVTTATGFGIFVVNGTGMRQVRCRLSTVGAGVLSVSACPPNFM